MTQDPSQSPPPPSSPPPPEPSWAEALALPLGLLGALLGAIAGALVVKLAADSGLYAMPLCGLTVGYGAVLLAHRGTPLLGLITALICLAAEFLIEWKVFYPSRFPDLLPFLNFIPQLPPFSLLLILVGAIAAAWIAWSTPPRRP